MVIAKKFKLNRAMTILLHFKTLLLFKVAYVYVCACMCLCMLLCCSLCLFSCAKTHVELASTLQRTYLSFHHEDLWSQTKVTRKSWNCLYPLVCLSDLTFSILKSSVVLWCDFYIFNYFFLNYTVPSIPKSSLSPTETPSIYDLNWLVPLGNHIELVFIIPMMTLLVPCIKPELWI